MKGNSQLRGELKTKARPLVKTFFGFDSGSNQKIIRQNWRIVEYLKETNNYIWGVRFPVVCRILTDANIL